MSFVTEDDLKNLCGAEEASFPSPVPTQIVSSEEYLPTPQNKEQAKVESELIQISDQLARKSGISRRRFFQTAAGMAASFLAMNRVYGEIFDVDYEEASTPEMADERGK